MLPLIVTHDLPPGKKYLLQFIYNCFLMVAIFVTLMIYRGTRLSLSYLKYYVNKWPNSVKSIFYFRKIKVKSLSRALKALNIFIHIIMRVFGLYWVFCHFKTKDRLIHSWFSIQKIVFLLTIDNCFCFSF